MFAPIKENDWTEGVLDMRGEDENRLGNEGQLHLAVTAVTF